jgi:hypothetical protein
MDGVNSAAVGVTPDVLVRLLDGTTAALSSLMGPLGADLFSYQLGIGPHMQHACNIEGGDQTDTLVSISLPELDPVTCGTQTQFMLPDGSYKAAGDLKTGDTLLGRFGPITLEADPVTSALSSPAQCMSLSVHGIGNFGLSCGLFVKSQNLNWS